ncbi:CRB1 [Auxenochlorella protothecoides x Auxenochlorella symbiontica]
MSEADTTVGQLVEPAAEEVTAPVEDPSTGDGATQPAGEEEKEAGNPAAPDTDAAAATAAAVAARLIQQHEEQAGAVYGSNPYDVSQTAAGFEGFPGPDGADGNNKRPRDGEGVEHEEDGPDKKRASTNFLSSEGQAAPENPGGAEGEAYGNPGPGLGDFSTSTTAAAPGYGAPAAAAGAGDPYAAAGAYGAYGGAQGYGAAAYGGAPGGAQAGGPAAGGLPGASAGGASQWQELHDDQGRAYYYNATTGVTQWERPADL